jgi:hypothetical protein
VAVNLPSHGFPKRQFEEWGDEQMRMTRRGFLGASAALAAGLGAAPARAWLMAPMLPAWVTSAPPVPGLGYLTALAIAPSDASTLLAGGDVHGLKRTTDAGQLWGQMDKGTWKAGRYGISAITPHPTQAGTYYALSGSDNSKGAVYKTTDSGGSWTLLKTGIVTEPQTGDQNGMPVLRVYGQLLALEPQMGGDILYAASYSSGLFKSTNGGGTWVNKGLGGMNLTAVVLQPGNPSTVYVGWRVNTTNWSDQNGGIKISHDAGTTWSDLLTGVPVRDLVIDPNQTSSIYVAALTGGVSGGIVNLASSVNNSRMALTSARSQAATKASTSSRRPSAPRAFSSACCDVRGTRWWTAFLARPRQELRPGCVRPRRLRAPEPHAGSVRALGTRQML